MPELQLSVLLRLLELCTWSLRQFLKELGNLPGTGSVSYWGLCAPSTPTALTTSGSQNKEEADSICQTWKETPPHSSHLMVKAIIPHSGTCQKKPFYIQGWWTELAGQPSQGKHRESGKLLAQTFIQETDWARIIENQQGTKSESLEPQTRTCWSDETWLDLKPPGLKEGYYNAFFIRGE